MNILIIGNGGREHALAWKIGKSPLVSKLFCTPGNGGTYRIAENVPIKPDSVQELADFAEQEKIDLTVVGPELPLTLGIVDEFTGRGLNIFGPDKKAAELEGSKVFVKDFLKKYNIPTAEYEVFDNPNNAKDYIRSRGVPLVVKADGLAAGKGVTVCKNTDEALAVVNTVMVEKKFGAAGDRIVVEEFLDGREVSFMAVTDGKNILPLASSQDHKAIWDGDMGPNTGGMGAYSPTPVVTEKMHQEIVNTIMRPAIEGMEREGRLYKGILYAGIMICDNKPRVLEFNVRFGDPETQPILLRMESDIVPLLNGAANSTLDKVYIKWREEVAACVIMASEGYPGNYETGKEIKGLEAVKGYDSLMVFHAGTQLMEGRIITGGGRVLGVTALGKDIKDSIEKAYNAVSKISYEGAYYRKDIGKGLAQDNLK